MIRTQSCTGFLSRLEASVAGETQTSILVDALEMSSVAADRSVLLGLACGFGLGVAVSVGVAAVAIHKYSGASPLPSSARARLAHEPKSKDREHGLMVEQLSRNRLFLGEVGQAEVEKSFVVVVGLGGVGSHAAHMLVRSGIGRLRLIDFDNVTLSSLNRHAVATRDDVGRPKVTICAERFHDIHPGCDIDCCDVLFNAATCDELLDGSPDYIIDAIDDISTKADLLEACRRKGIKVISALAAGAKADPTRILIGDLLDTTNDALAVKLRYELRSRSSDVLSGGISTIKTVFSYEKAKAELAALEADQMKNPENYGAISGMRIRVVPVLGTQPALFGMMVASSVLTDIAKAPFVPRKVEPISQTFAKKLASKLRQREREIFKNNEATMPIADATEVAYVVEQLWRGKSAFSDARIESRNVFVLTRFDRSKPALPYNLLFLTREEAKFLDSCTEKTGSMATASDLEKENMCSLDRYHHIEEILKHEQTMWN